MKHQVAIYSQATSPGVMLHVMLQPRYQKMLETPIEMKHCIIMVKTWRPNVQLVGGFFHPSEKYEFVNWDDDIPNIWEK